MNNYLSACMKRVYFFRDKASSLDTYNDAHFSSQRVCTIDSICENTVGNIILLCLIALSPNKLNSRFEQSFRWEEFEYFSFVPPYGQQSGQTDISHLPPPKCRKPVPTQIAN